MGDLSLRPVSLREANRFVDLYHRHNGPARGHLFQRWSVSL